MKALLLSLVLLISTLHLQAQYASVPVSGFNNDIIANGGAASGAAITGVTYPAIGVDGAGYSLVTQGYLAGAVTPTCWMPTTNLATSLLNPLVTYQFQGYGSSTTLNNNALTITSPSVTYASPFASTNSLTLATPSSYAKFSILVESVLNNGAANTVDAVVNFTDGTTQTFTGFSYANWFSGSATTTAFYQFNRVNATNGLLNVCTAGTYTSQPNMYEMNLNISAANYGKLVSSITFTSTSTSSTGTGSPSVNYIHIMAVNGLAPCAVPSAQPTAPLLTAVSTGQIDGSFTAAAGAPNGYLVVRYPAGAAVTLPVNGTSYNVAQNLGLGTVVQSAASTTFSSVGLSGGTSYDFYVYSYNNAATCSGPMYLTSSAFIGSMSTNACAATITGIVPIGAGYPNTAAGGYTSITAAMADINATGLAGATILELQPSYTTAYSASNETYPITFSSNACISSTNNLTIRPAASVSTAISITTANTTATFNFNGGDNVTIDGRAGGVGTTSMLSISNTNAGASPAIQFINDALGNTVKYCGVSSTNTSATSGTIFFGSTNGISGNDNNSIDNCAIQAGATTPVNAIYSAALTTGTDNGNNSVTNCTIANYYSATLSSAGINLGTFNNAWTITGNKLFQSANRIYTTANTHYGINIQSGEGYTVSGNTIGYANAAGTGTTNMIGNSVALTGTFPTAYTVTGTATATRFVGINAALKIAGVVSNIQGNTIGGIALYTSSGANTTYGILCGIQVTSGNANIGTTTGNTIGSTGSGLGSLYAATTTTGGTVVGIYATSDNTVTIQNNNIGSIDASGTSATLNGGITGIDVAGAGNFSITNNTIGSATTGNMRNGFIQSGTSLGAGGATMTSTTGAGPFLGVRSAATGTTLNMNNNTIRNFVTSSTVSAFTGVQNTGIITNVLNINNNTVSGINYLVANSGIVYYFYNSTGTTTTVANINGNNIQNITYASTSTSTMYFIYAVGTLASYSISNNTVTGSLTLPTTGTIYLMYAYQGSPYTTISNNNMTGTGITKTGTSGSIYGYYEYGSPSISLIISGNTMSNITMPSTCTGVIYGIYMGGSTSCVEKAQNNTLTNWTAGTGTIYGIYFGGGQTGSEISGNTINTITSASLITAMNIVTASNGLSVFNNTIHTLTETGAFALTGINHTAGTLSNIYKNKIYNLNANNAAATAIGLSVTGATLANVYNNLIGDLKSTNSSGTNQLIGMSITGGTTVNSYYNTVRLNATSTGAIFGSSAISVNATPTTVNLRNNIFINTSTANTTGLTVAYRRASTSLGNYASTSNNNIFYAGTPSATNLIFTDGTNNDQSIISYKVRVAPSDALSGTENTSFLSTTGSSANFLHINGSVASISESGAANIAGLTTDYDNDIRSGNTGYAGTGTAPDMGADEYAGIAAAALAAPINFTSNTATVSSFNITWDDNSAGEAGFIVSRSLSLAGPFVVVASVTSSSSSTTGTTYTLPQSGLLGNTTYYYQIVAANASNSAALTGSAATLPCGSGLSGTFLIPGAYPTLTAGIADLVTNGMTGPVIFELDPTYSSASETYPITFGNNIGCLNATNTLTVRPAATVTAPLSITSANVLATINVNGGNYVTIDGRPGGVGTSKMLNLINTAAAGVTVQFTNDASNNAIKYCDVQGQNTNATPTLTLSGGVIFFNSANTSNLQGNDNNAITYCDIHGTSATSAGFPAISIASFGTSTTPASYNDYGNISNNNIYDYFHGSASSTGIKLDAGNTAWTINNNRFYQTTVLTFGTSTAASRALWITPNTGGIANAANGFTINNNFIGGNSANGTGMYTFIGTGNPTTAFMGMDISVGLGAVTTVQNNTITKINMATASTSSSAVVGINIANGVTNVTGNTIGSATSNTVPYSITFATSGTLGGLIGIRVAAGGANTVTNNTVAGIELRGDASLVAPSFNGLNYSGGTSCVMNNNTVGSATLANSIYLSSLSATSTSASNVRGIISNVSALNSTINNNLIANITTNYSGTGSGNSLVGIAVQTGTSVMTGNTIRNLASASNATGTGSSSAILGIVYTSTTLPTAILPTSITSNTIHTLKLTNATNTTATVAEGIFFSGSATAGAVNVIDKNFIHSFSHANNANSASNLTGMDIAAGIVTIKNNMIRLGIDDNGSDVLSPCTIRGISESSAISNIFNNSIYIGGINIANSTSNSFAYQRSAASGYDSVLNNIFVNNRSNASTGGKHYQVYLTTSTAVLTLNNNVYNGTGIGSVFGYNSATDAAYVPSWIAGDANSQTGDPIFIAPTDGAASLDMHLDTGTPTPAEQNGVFIASVTDDFDGQVRSSLSPTDIGADADNFVVIPPCSGTPLPGNAALTSLAPVCGSGARTMSMPGYVNQSGLSYKWQQSTTGAAGPFTDVATGGTAIVYTTPVLTASAWYRCRINCANSGDSNFSSVVAIIVNTVNPVSASAASPSICVPGNAGTTLSASGASTYAWSPTAGLTPSTGIGSSVAAFPSLTTLYTVVGTDAVGCTSSATVSVNVVLGMNLSGPTASPSNICQGANSNLTSSAIVPATVNLYNFTAGTGTTLDPMVGATQVLNASNDDTPTASPSSIGFSFNFDGSTYTQYSVSPDGWLLLGPTTAVSSFTNTTTLATNIPKIYPIWDDLATGTDGSVKVLVTGTAPNRIFKVQWQLTIPRNTVGASNSTFQAWLYEFDGKIEYRYGTMGVSTTSCSVGMTGNPSANYKSVTIAGNTVSSTVPNDAQTTVPPIGTIYTFTNPAIGNTINYSWTPTTYLSNATISSPVATAVMGSTTYTVTATSSNGCTASGSVSLTVDILNAAPISTKNYFCPGTKDSLIANVTGGGQPYTYSWTSSTGGTYPTTAIFVDSPMVTTTYTVNVTDACGNSASGSVTANVVIPTILSTVPGTRCGYGPVNLAVNTNVGVSANWYTNPTGGAPIGSGTTFTTPSIAATTTFYASAIVGSGVLSGLGCTTVPTTSGFNAKRGIQFDLYQNITLNSFDFYAAYAGTTTLTVELQNSAGTVLQTAVLTDVSTIATLAPHTVPLNFIIPAGIGYKLLCTFNTGSLSNYSHSTGANYASSAFNNLGSAGIITNGLEFGPVASTTAYYYFYNLNISAGCESARVPITAAVTAPPATTITAGYLSLCPGGSTTLSVSSPNAGYTYSWTSQPTGFTGTGAGPLTVAPTLTTKYYVLAQDNSAGAFAGCANLDSVTIVTGSILTAGLVSASQNQLCVSGTPILTAAGAGGGALQWQVSTVSNSGPWTNVGSGLSTYTPSAPITQTSYFRMQVMCQTTTIYSNVETVNVNNPQLISTTPGSRCGTGNVSLSATAPAGTSANWYADATTYVPLATGTTSFTTPTISSTTTFYVAPTSGIGTTQISSNGAPTVFTATQAGGLVFTLTQDVVLNSIQVYSNGVGTATVTLLNSANTVLYTSTAQPIAALGLSTPQTLTLGWAIPIGVGYKITVSNTANSLGYMTGVFPQPMGNGVGTITGGALGTGTSTLHYFVYNMNTTTGCAGARVPVVATVIAPPAITVASTASTLCNGQSATLSVTSPNPSYSYTWMPGNISGASTVVTPSSNTVYSLTAIDNSGGTYNTCATQASTAIVVNPVPTAITVTPSSAAICLGSSQAFTATGGTVGGIYTLGTGTTSTTATAVTPYSSLWEGVHVQYILTASELNALGMVAGNINSMAFDVSALGGTGPNWQNNYTIKMAHTNDAAFVAGYATPIGSLNTVYGPVTQGLPALGWNTYTFNSAFSWNGSSNIIIDVCHDNDLNNSCAACYTSSSGVNASTTSFNSVYGTYNDNAPACGVSATSVVGPGTLRPNIRFNSQTPTTLAWTPAASLSSATGNSVTATPTATTTYTVSATNIFSCTSSANVTVTVNQPTSSSSTITACGSYLWNGATYTASGLYTYTSLNAAGCTNTATLDLTINCSVTLNMTCYIQGYWDAGSNAMSPVLFNQGEVTTATACDSMDVELRDATTYGLVSSIRTVLNQDGTATCVFPTSYGSYYIVIKHRNAIQTWSANPIYLGASPVSYNFSTAASQAYGDNQIEVSTGVWALFSGDIVIDENIDLLDLGFLENDISIFAYGYISTDVNGDGNVDLLDSPTLESNISNFIFSYHP
jgi:hypothetical protein